MVDLYAFNALRYNPSKINDLSLVISPPYDIINSDLRENLKEYSDLNIVNLILPDGSGQLDKYQNASRILNKWMDDKILLKDDEKKIYIFEEKYIHDGKLKNIIGLISLIKIEQYSSKIVLRHEKTLSKPRQDRFELLKNCRTNFGLIYTLYDDDKAVIADVISKKIKERPETSLTPRYDESLSFNVWSISNNAEIDKVRIHMKDKSVLIADGHHRYETSRLYMDESTSTDDCSPEKYVLVLLMDINQKNIELLPTHRLIRFKKSFSAEAIRRSLKEKFDITNFKKDCYPSSQAIKELMQKELKKTNKSFVFCTKSEDLFIATLKKEFLPSHNKNRADHIYENMDVNILHRLILEDCLKDHQIKDISFTHEISQVLKKVSILKEPDMGVIINAPDKNDVLELSLSGKLMPQKSTYFYPKPCTGLLMYKFD
jgi:uncharacterized protein (DUF1015 family)